MNGISGICGDQANSVSTVEKGNVQGPLKTQSLLIAVLAPINHIVYYSKTNTGGMNHKRKIPHAKQFLFDFPS